MIDSTFSLTLALQSIARRSGRELNLDDLHAALGLSMMFCAVPAETDPSNWFLYARDAYLIPAARLFGLAIRELHPPEAAVGLSGLVEFAQHFDASYRPLIHRALEHDQGVLAWQGWPGTSRLSWGVIVEPCSEGVGFRGTVDFQDSDPEKRSLVPLESAPVQVYVVEECSALPADDSAVLDAALFHASEALHGHPSARFGVLMGTSAIDFWIHRINALRSESSTSPGCVSGHHRCAVSIMASFHSAIRMLESHSTNSDVAMKRQSNEEKRRAAVAILGHGHRIIGSLSSLADFPAFRMMLTHDQGRVKVIQSLAQVRTAAIDIMAVIDHLLVKPAPSLDPSRRSDR